MPSISAIILLLIIFCTHACKENAQEKESVFELNKFEADRLEIGKGFHLGGGLCIYKAFQSGVWVGGPERTIYIRDCHGALPADTSTPTEKILKYKQGGLCFYHDCDIKPEESFTVFMKAPEGFIDLDEYYNIFASKYNDSTMLYRHTKDFAGTYDLLLNGTYEYLDSLVKYLNGKVDIRPKHKPFREDAISVSFKYYDKFWEELFSIAKPLKIKGDSLKQCNSKFCSTKDFLEPLYKIECLYGIERKVFDCFHDTLKFSFSRRRIKPKCLTMLESLSKEHNILMHSGAFPAGDCDLSNWRYLKIDSLSKEHYEKLKEVLRK